MVKMWCRNGVLDTIVLAQRSPIDSAPLSGEEHPLRPESGRMWFLRLLWAARVAGSVAFFRRGGWGAAWRC